jgi:hypothetical protein
MIQCRCFRFTLLHPESTLLPNHEDMNCILPYRQTLVDVGSRAIGSERCIYAIPNPFP